MIFVFSVFLISLKTHGYCYGIISAIASVFAVNFAFTYPYYTFDFFVEESILSAVIMLVVAISTSTLNIRIRAENLIVAGFQICFNEALDVGFILYDQDLKFVIAHRPHPLFPEQS